MSLAGRCSFKSILKESEMRKFAGISFATAGFGLILSASSATAITISAPAGLRLGIETNGVVEPIHCRRYGHGHRYGHQWGSGCRVGVVVTPKSRSVRLPPRSRTIVRTPIDPGVRVPTRSGDRLPGVNTSIRTGGDASTSNTIRSGMGNNPAAGASTRTAPAASTGSGRRPQARAL